MNVMAPTPGTITRTMQDHVGRVYVKREYSKLWLSRQMLFCDNLRLLH